MAHHQAIVTGGLRARDTCHLWNFAEARTFSVLVQSARGFGCVSCDDFTAGGPIDAPETIPAGAMSCIEWVDWRGRPIVSQFELPRD